MRAASFSASIVVFLTAFLIFSHLVAGGGGWYIDTESCNPDAARFLESKLRRARVAHINLATFLRNFDPNQAWDFPELPNLLYQVLGGSIEAALRDATLVFAGGQDRTTQILGLSSWTGAVEQEKTKDSPNGLIIYCNAGRIAVKMEAGILDNGELPLEMKVYDSDSKIYYPAAMPACGREFRAGWENAIALIHSPRRNRKPDGNYEPDRITFCQWFIDGMVNVDYGTQETIYQPRRLASRFRNRDGTYNMDGWRAARNTYFNNVPNLPDIDYSIAFETMLTSVLAHTTAGGHKSMVANNIDRNGIIGYEGPFAIFPPADSWGEVQNLVMAAQMNQDPGLDVPEQASFALPYMIINSSKSVVMKMGSVPQPSSRLG